MSGMSIHVVDIARGAVAKGMRVRVERLEGEARVLVAEGAIGANGLLPAPRLADMLDAGVYEVTFHVGDYLQGLTSGGERPFLDIAPFRFTLRDPRRHCHLPFKFTPYGFSCFRGAE